MNKGLDFKDELTKNDFRYISLVWVSVNQFFLVLLSKYLLSLTSYKEMAIRCNLINISLLIPFLHLCEKNPGYGAAHHLAHHQL